MERVLLDVRNFVEVRTFGVCTYLGEKMGIPIRNIRLFFVYASFIAMGSPVIIYMSMAFMLNIKKYIRSSKKVIVNL